MRNKNFFFPVFSLLLVLFSLPSQGQNLKVMSYNIHHGADAAEQMTLREMGAFIKKSGADLVGLQEVDSLCGRSGNIDQMKVLAEITGMHYAFYRHFAYDGGAYGLGILSRYPIKEQSNKRITSMKNGRKESLAFLSVKLNTGRRELVFSTVHMALDQPTRLIQAEEIMHHLAGSESVILTGDFNALPDTKEIQLISERLTFMDQGLAHTFPAAKPVKKIDYIFVSPSLLKGKSSTGVRKQIQYSDHLPLEAKLKL
ncbi:endonuclease/exonuclease/phosphatase family protein [Parapedobacter sp. DT-150]